MTSERQTRQRHGSSRVRPPHGGRAAGLLAVGLLAMLVGFLLLAALAALAWLPSAIATPSHHRHPVAAIALLGSAAVVVAIAEFARRTVARPGQGSLTLVVGPDEIGFERHGELVDRVGRAEVGVVVIKEFRRSVIAIAVRGPAGDAVGQWDTGWLSKSDLFLWLALRRYGWPWARQNGGQLRKVSKNAPAWIGTVAP